MSYAFVVGEFPRPHFQFEDPLFKRSYAKIYEEVSKGGQELFRKWVYRCRSCSLRQGDHAPVLPEGDIASKYIFVGRNPGKQEDKYKRPFYPHAPSGYFLEEVLDRLHIKREDCYITNSCFCHGEKDRAPSPMEREMCLAWKLAEFRLLTQARYIFPLGNEALFTFINKPNLTISRAFGSVWRTRAFEGRTLHIVPLYHPAHLLRHPAMKNAVLIHLNGVREFIKLSEEGGNIRENHDNRGA